MSQDLATIHKQADSAQAIELSTKLEQWRYVDFKRIADENPAASTSANPDVPTWLGTEALVIDNGVVCKSDIPKAWQLDSGAAPSARIAGLANSDCPHQLACVNSSSHSHVRNISGMSDAPLIIILRSSGGRYGMNISIHAAAGSIADIIVVHDHCDDAELNYALHVNLERDAAIRIDETSLHGNNSRIYHHKLADVQHSANLTWQHMGFANAIDRHLWHAQLHDIEAFCNLSSACMASGDRQAHHVAQVDHLSPKSRSEQTFKSIAMDTSRYSFNGLVHMAKGADESASNQQNSNLQLSPKARIHSRPQLDIHTDDVIAAHGSATGPTDAAELYYLRTRGLSADQAERIIVRGFLQEVTNQFHSKATKAWAADRIISSLDD